MNITALINCYPFPPKKHVPHQGFFLFAEVLCNFDLNYGEKVTLTATPTNMRLGEAMQLQGIAKCMTLLFVGWLLRRVVAGLRFLHSCISMAHSP